MRWGNEVVPDDWDSGILVSVFKKGNMIKPEQCSGIYRIDFAAKAFTIVTVSLFWWAGLNHAEFGPACGCTGQIFAFCHGYPKPTAICLGSLRRHSIPFVARPWTDNEIRRYAGNNRRFDQRLQSPPTIVRVLAHNNFSQSLYIRLWHSTKVAFCRLFPSNYYYFLDFLFERPPGSVDGVAFAPGHQLSDLDRVDDVALLASTFDDLRKVVPRLMSHKRSCVRALYRRVETHCSEPEDKIAELQYLRRVFEANGYLRNFVNRCIRKKDERPNRTDTKSWRALPYVKKVSEVVGRLLSPLGVGVAHRPEATIRRLVMKPKDPLPRLESFIGSGAVADKATTSEKPEDSSEREWPNTLQRCGEMTPAPKLRLIRRDPAIHSNSTRPKFSQEVTTA
ncbi:hypothetical protein SprV_0100055400 [Sparganum proliferum]